MTDFEPPRFGTDGIRGPAGEPPLDPPTLRRIGAALGIWLQRTGPDPKRVLIANDGRESALWILEALAQGLSSVDAIVSDLGLATTPMLAHLTRSGPFVAGVMISASHNPARDNGIKLFDADGRKLADDAEREIELLTTRVSFGTLTNPRSRDASSTVDEYLEYLGNEFGHLDLDGATVVVDAANGGSSIVAPAVLRALGADVVPIACEPDGFNINDGCGALHAESIRDSVRHAAAVLGICLDGDGDRSIFVDDRGGLRDGDSILATLAPILRDRGELPGDTVVTTIMSNLGLRRHLGRLGIAVETTPVGDRSVAARRRVGGFRLGAEPSGHVLFERDGHLIGDGLYTALTLLSLPGLVERGAAAVFDDFERFPQRLVNVPVLRQPPLADVPRIADRVRELERQLGDDSRVILRYSGTEPLCRVMVEAPSAELVDRVTAELAELVRAELGA